MGVDWDVIIVGAGLSGVGAACHLRMRSPDRTFIILEGRAAMGGTWDLFRYPGVRSDSDMFTLGYSFRPWRSSQSIATGPSIRQYIADTARHHGVDGLIRYHHRVIEAAWSTADATWTVSVQRTDNGQRLEMTCRFLYMCAGYYRYDHGYEPPFPGRHRFSGPVVHPQKWPESLDYAGRRVVVIGSGATAVTLVPAMAERAGHVTMLQRSPSYILSVPSHDPLAEALARRLPQRLAYSLVWWRNVIIATLLYQASRRWPHQVRRALRAGVVRQLPPGYDVDRHFGPRYHPWDQRMCLVPDSDLFRAIRRGQASVVTGDIESFTETGVKLTSGVEVPADIIVTATGLQLATMGGARLSVDGVPVSVPDSVVYRGMMLCGVPNLAFTMGYINASWTLKADLVADYVCRLLNHMAGHGHDYCIPQSPDPGEPTRPFIGLTSGYVRRSLADLPKQGARRPWLLQQNYLKDMLLFRHTPVDQAMEFGCARQPAAVGGGEKVPTTAAGAGG
ncbi:MAG TPA: NAD(P)/FAD-dependent oxidoreductase [Acidimicrobiales bacterium]|nr:NAD(P)/FAD-dependent oxidoreductase [Acidimicrobiales bacterium]